MEEAMEGTWLSKPKSPSLDDLVALKAEMSGQMFDCVMRFIRQRCGVKTEGVTRAHVRAAFHDFGYEYELSNFTSVDEKEVEVDGKKVKKTVTSHGDVLVVKDPIDRRDHS